MACELLILKLAGKTGTQCSSQKNWTGNETYGYFSFTFQLCGKVQPFILLTTETDLTISANSNHSDNVPLPIPFIFPWVTYYFTELLLNSVSAADILARMQIVYFPQD